MRKLLLGLLAVMALSVVSESASARERPMRSSARYYRQAAYSQPQPMVQYSYDQGSRPGVFGQIIEMERRKNAWLRSAFFGR